MRKMQAFRPSGLRAAVEESFLDHGGIRARGLDHAHRVGIRVLEFALDAGNLELRDLLVAEASVLMELEDNVPGLREEGLLEEGIRADAVDHLTALGMQTDLAVAGHGRALGHRDLAARNGERHVDLVRLGLVEQIAHLVMEGGELARLGDVHVVAQAVEDLRAVVLRIHHLEVPRLDVGLRFGAARLRMGVDAVVAEPLAGQRSNGPEHRKRIGIGGRFRIDVLVLHFSLL